MFWILISLSLSKRFIYKENSWIISMIVFYVRCVNMYIHMYMYKYNIVSDLNTAWYFIFVLYGKLSLVRSLSIRRQLQ